MRDAMADLSTSTAVDEQTMTAAKSQMEGLFAQLTALAKSVHDQQKMEEGEKKAREKQHKRSASSPPSPSTSDGPHPTDRKIFREKKPPPPMPSLGGEAAAK